MASTDGAAMGTTTLNMVLLAIYSAVLLSGTVGLSLMVHTLRSPMRSVTSIAVFNLIFTHFLFLLTVPFRIYYYATNNWGLGDGWCKVVSSMIHIHMYMSFLFYVVILVIRLLAFYGKSGQVEFSRVLHALLASVAIWLLLAVTTPCVVSFRYGNRDAEADGNRTDTQCFNFSSRIEKEEGATVFNYVISTVIVAVACVLAALQANVLLVLYRRYGRGCGAQQVFWAQLKSLCFALVMVVCLVPYHMFRLYYIKNLRLQDVNEVFLTLTTLSCLDMLTFLGRGSCSLCHRGQRM